MCRLKRILKLILSFIGYFAIFAVIYYIISDEKDIVDALITSLIASGSWHIFFELIPYLRKKRGK